jgi:hypothetical protein
MRKKTEVIIPFYIEPTNIQGKILEIFLSQVKFYTKKRQKNSIENDYKLSYNNLVETFQLKNL